MATSQKFASFLDLPPTQTRHKPIKDCSGLTPQENLQQIMTHPLIAVTLSPKSKNWY
jgi:hypothetical protein